MSTSIKNANPVVSNAILKALGNDARGKPQISAREMTQIRKAAIAEVKKSTQPVRTLTAVKASLTLADRVTAGRYKDDFSELVSGPLKTAVETRREYLRQHDVGAYAPRGSNYYS